VPLVIRVCSHRVPQGYDRLLVHTLTRGRRAWAESSKEAHILSHDQAGGFSPYACSRE
jgi:hypothetical protein